MTDQITPETKPRKTHWGRWGLFFSFLGLAIFMGAFGYGYFQLSKVNITLAQMVSGLQNKLATNQQELQALQKSVTDLQQGAQKSQELVSQQEQLLSDWKAAQKGDLQKWYVAEAQYLVKLANDHLQYTHNISMAVVLLQRADQILDKQNDQGLLELRKSIATVLAAIQAAPQVDVTDIYLHLSALNNQVDRLPLPASPLRASDETKPIPEGMPWWKAGLQHTWEALKKIVVVRYNSSNTLPLVLPEEKMFLYQNLHAQLENAIWALLHRDGAIYQTSLARAQNWIQLYFVMEAPETKSMAENLQALQKINIQPPTIDMSETLQRFDQYLAQNGHASAQ